MNKFSKISTALSVAMIPITSAQCQTETMDNTHQMMVQDTAKAAQFFENELNFKTNPHGVKAVLDGKIKNVTIVDLRTAKDFAEGHIPGAVNIPFDEHKGFDGNETSFEKLRKDGYNYVYCYQLLCNLGQKAAKKFASLGYPVKEIVGGYQSWKQANLPIEQ